MKITLHQIRNLFSLLIVFCYTQNSLADGLTTKSMLVSLALPAVAGAYSFTIGDKEGLKELGLSCLVTAHATTLLKYSVSRTRPNGEDDMSFPSGHASSAFMGASYLHHRYGLAWGVPMYGIAAVIGYQRVDADDHHWTDVIAGAALGYFVAYFFTVKYPNVWLEPDIDAKRKTMALQIKARL